MSSAGWRMGQRGRRETPDDGGRLMDQLVVLERGHHEEGEVHTPGEVAGQDWVADVSTPHGQPLALPLLEAAPAHDGPPAATGEYPPAGLHLVADVADAEQAGQPGEHTQHDAEPPVHPGAQGQ